MKVSAEKHLDMLWGECEHCQTSIESQYKTYVNSKKVGLINPERVDILLTAGGLSAMN